MAQGLSVALPLSVAEDDGPYKLHKDLESVAEQHLKMIVLTAPGERVMDAAFGVGMRNYLFEQGTPVVSNEIKSRIKQQVDKYTPFIKILKINSVMDPDNALLTLEIRYSVPNANIVSDLTIPISA
jgi:phage baseplate assembly protein W